MRNMHQQQETSPADELERQIGVISGLALRNEAVRSVLDAALGVIRTLFARLIADVSAANERASQNGQRVTDEQRRRQRAERVASYSQVMAEVLRDLSRLLPREELSIKQTDDDGWEYRVVGYDALDITVYFGQGAVTVNNTTKGRRSRTLYFDNVALSSEVFLAIEALFKEVELTKNNTPRRVHDELFEDESDQGPRVSIGVMFGGPSCGNPDCPVHGDNGLLNSTSEVPEAVRRLVEKIFGANVEVVSDGMGFSGFANMV